MNKKLLLVLFGLFAVSLVTAGALTYYKMYSVNVNVTQPIVVTGNLQQDVICESGDTCPGELITIKNIGENDRTITIGTIVNESIDVTYTSTLELSQKVVNFDLDIWDLLEGGNTTTVDYVVTGGDFTAKVTGEEFAGYVLIYYADNDDRFDYPNSAVYVEDVTGELPAVGDKNMDVNDYSLEYPTTPHGAKLWYVPSDAILDGMELDWSRASEFLFETKLIQSGDDFVIYPNSSLTVTPQYSVDKYLPTETYPAETTVA